MTIENPCLDCGKEVEGNYHFWCDECGWKHERDYQINVLGWLAPNRTNKK